MVKAVKIINEGKELEIDFGDEIRIYTARNLRINCGCANCEEEWSGKRILEPTSVSSDIVLEDFMYIGKYALQFLWSDEHFTGIFPFTVLKNLD